MILETKEKRLNFLEKLEIDKEMVIYLTFDGENSFESSATIKWVDSMLRPGWEFEMHIGSFPLRVDVPLKQNASDDNKNINGYAKIIDIYHNDKTFVGYPQNLVDNYIWKIDESLFNNTLENETSRQRGQKLLAINVLRQGKGPKKQ